MSYPGEQLDTEIVPQTNSQFDIKKFLFKLIGFLPWIILSILICYTVGRIYLRYTPQVHKIAAYMLIKDEEENNSDNKILEDLGVMPDSKEVQNQIDILQSYTLLAGIVDSLNLQIQMIDQGRIASSPLYAERMPIFIKPAKNDSSFFQPGSSYVKIFTNKFSINEGGKAFYYNYNDTFLLLGKKVVVERNVNVKPDPNGYLLIIRNYHEVAMSIKSGINVRLISPMGGIIEVAMIDEIPERAFDIINKLIQAYNTAGLIDKNTAGYKTLGFINDRIDTVSNQLDDVESKLDSYRKENQITDLTEQEKDYLTLTSQYDQAEVEQTGNLEILESLEKYIRTSTNYTDIIPSNRGLAEPTLGKLIDTYNDAVLLYQNQSRISTDRDPVMMRQKTNITELKGNILKNIQDIKAGYHQKINQLHSLVGNSSNSLQQLPEKEKGLVNLQRQATIKETLYTFLLQKKQETEISLASNINNTRILDPAYDQGVVKPDAGQIKNFSILIGLLVPIIIMVLLDFFNNKIADKKEIEVGTSVPIIGEISFDNKVTKRFVTSESRSVLAEQFRLIRTNLQYMTGDKPIKTILITSFMSGEGKSFISMNLASNLSVGGTKIILIELDLRKPKFSKYLDIQPEYGLTDHIVNDNISIPQIISRSNLIPNIDIITSGPVPPNPTELLISKKLELLFHWAKENYDYVIFDSSPVGLVADAYSLDKYAEISMFIFRHNYTYKTTIQFAEKLFKEKRFKNLGIIVNGISNIRGMGYGYGYGYGYSYGYGYHYGNGYYEGKTNKGFFGKIFSLFKRK